MKRNKILFRHNEYIFYIHARSHAQTRIPKIIKSGKKTTRRAKKHVAIQIRRLNAKNHFEENHSGTNKSVREPFDRSTPPNQPICTRKSVRRGGFDGCRKNPSEASTHQKIVTGEMTCPEPTQIRVVRSILMSSAIFHALKRAFQYINGIRSDPFYFTHSI